MQHIKAVLEAEKADYRRIYVQCVQAMVDYWAAYLVKSECQVLNFIIDRTLRWGKCREVIPYAHMVKGVRSSKGDTINAGVGVGRASVFRAMDSLKAMRFIDVTKSCSTASGYMANVIEINFKQIMERDMAGLPTPKKLRERRGPPLSHGETPLVSKRDYPLSQSSTTNIHKGNRLKGIDRKSIPPAGAFGTVEEALSVARQRTAEARRQKAERLSTSMTHRSLLARWQECILSRYERVSPQYFTEKDFIILKRNVGLYLSRSDIYEFLQWVVDNWSRLRGNELSWLNKKKEFMPAGPDLQTVVRFLRAFTKVYLSEQSAREDQTRYTSPTREAALAKDLAAAQKQLAQAQKKNEVLEQANHRLRRSRPAAVATTAPISDAALADAANVYADDEGVGEWQPE